MLVVAVALSTATYAWFTSNATVKANSITMVATTNAAPTIGISWTNGNYGTEITPVITSVSDNAAFTFAPVAPASLSKTGTITTSDVLFKTAEAYSDGGVYKFVNAGANATVQSAYTWKDDVAGTHKSFFVKNLSTANALVGDLTLSASITGDGADLIRIGVFKYNSSAATTDKYELIEVLANKTAGYTVVASGTTLAAATQYYKIVLGQYVLATAGTSQEVTDGTADYEAGVSTAPADTYYTATGSDVHATAVYGSITADKVVNTMDTYTCAESVNIATNLAAEGVVELRIIAWMDGAALGNDQQEDSVNIVLNFAIVPTV